MIERQGSLHSYFFQGFQPQIFVIVFSETLLLFNTEYFNVTLEKHKVVYCDGTSNYLTKRDFDGVPIIF